MPEIISRKEAIARGLTRYFTGKPCKHGHICEYFVEGWKCQQCHVAASADYYARNKDHKKDYVALRRKTCPEAYQRQLEANRRYQSTRYAMNLDVERSKSRERERKKADLIAVLREEMPDLLKEFGL